MESMVFGNTSLSQSEWWYRYVQGVISLGTSFWQSSFKTVQKLVAYWLGATSRAWSVKSALAAVWWSVSLVVGATEQGLQHANTYCVDSCFWEIKLLHWHIQNFVRFIVAFLGQFVNIDWIGILAKNSAK